MEEFVRTECHGNGVCDNDKHICNCTSGISEGQYCQTCLTGYVENNQGVCAPAACISNGHECSNHGYCLQLGDLAMCGCFPGYAGLLCEECDVDHTLFDGACVSNVCVNKLDEAYYICSDGGEC